jgi:hypothetical protein
MLPFLNLSSTEVGKRSLDQAFADATLQIAQVYFIDAVQASDRLNDTLVRARNGAETAATYLLGELAYVKELLKGATNEAVEKIESEYDAWMRQKDALLAFIDGSKTALDGFLVGVKRHLYQVTRYLEGKDDIRMVAGGVAREQTRLRDLGEEASRGVERSERRVAEVERGATALKESGDLLASRIKKLVQELGGEDSRDNY